MANLTAVLRKTIDGLPNASPQLRAKVYEKARAAITRQIEAANPPLDDHVVEARYRVLEDAIRETEAHYAPPPEPAEPEPVQAEPDTFAPSQIEEAAPAEPPREAARPAPPPAQLPEPDAWTPPPPIPPRTFEPGTVSPRSLLRQTPAVPGESAAPSEPSDGWSAPVRLDEPQAPAVSGQTERAPQPAFPRATPTTRPPATPAFPRVSTNEQGGVVRPGEPTLDRPAVPSRGPVTAPEHGFVPERRPLPPGAAPSATQGAAGDDAPRVGEVGPAEAPTDPIGNRQLRPATISQRTSAREPANPGSFAGIPEPDLAAPRYPARRARSKDRSRLGLGVAAVAIVALGAAGWFYLDDIRSLVTGGGSTQVATTSPGTTDQGEPPTAVPSDQTPATAAAPQGQVTDTAPGAATPAAGGVRPRQFTQRLQADGSEVDEGPGVNAGNAFEEGTNVVAAEVNPAPAQSRDTPAATTPATPEATTPPAAATPPAQAPIAVGQRAVFYEERSADREGTQQDGNVVWSVVREAPAEGQPPEPAIRGVAEIPSTGMKMTMTIRRNADETLPASHVIEIMFDTPNGAPGGGIENVQRLALKPTEQARGEPLIGISGKISDGFFIIALNDLEQAMRTNLSLLGREEWIDIPLAYTSGQRALMSVEKGIPGSRVFKEALDAWAAKT
ncbi:hypothetical protein [Aureimonas sp. AU20]|uniref:hypothetical protein n=1 Tax=Aureimonas sp. AU20 TaxID=1349819 RepID=UPI0007214198|nr:hypothetical protein [Aureimonas sp. AU20]ALN74022.1 hypothetical protein M673_14950 [Aureimonas sp. AU20]